MSRLQTSAAIGSYDDECDGEQNSTFVLGTSSVQSALYWPIRAAGPGLLG